MSASCRVRVSVSRSTGETLCRRRRRGPRCAGTPGDAGRRRCAYCATAVPPGAVPARLCRPRGPRVVTYVIAEPCVDVKDKACIDECPVDCIYEGCLLYTSDAADEEDSVDLGGRRIIKKKKKTNKY